MGSCTLRKRTLMPEAGHMGMVNCMVMGGRDHCLSLIKWVSTTSPFRMMACPPASLGTFHSMTLFVGEYWHFPPVVFTFTFDVLVGTGTLITMSCATLYCSNRALTFTWYSTRLRPRSLTIDDTSKGRFVLLMRYVIRSYSPSGGMNMIVLSESYRFSRTHWWKVTSCRSMPLLADTFFFEPRASRRRCIATLSLSPKRQMGMPDSDDFIAILPLQYDESTLFCWLMITFTFSITSRYTSFFAYVYFPGW